jgi:hypothetical protein
MGGDLALETNAGRRSARGAREVAPEGKPVRKRLEGASPLFFVAAIAYGLAVFNFETPGHGGARLPLWLLFTAVGTIVVGGGMGSVLDSKGDEDAVAFSEGDLQDAILVQPSEWEQIQRDLTDYKRLRAASRDQRTDESDALRGTPVAQAERALAELEGVISKSLGPQTPSAREVPAEKAEHAGPSSPRSTEPSLPTSTVSAPSRKRPVHLDSDPVARVLGAQTTKSRPPAGPPSVAANQTEVKVKPAEYSESEARTEPSWRETISPELAKLVTELYPETAAVRSLVLPLASGSSATVSCAGCGEPTDVNGETERCHRCGKALCEVCIASALLDNRSPLCRPCREPPGTG